MITAQVVVRSNRLPEIAKRLPAAVREIMQEDVARTVEDVKARGRDPDSVESEVTDTEAIVYSVDPWEMFSEFGTSKEAAQPAYVPALGAAAARIPETFGKLEAKL